MSFRLEQLFVKRVKGTSVDNTVVLTPLVPTGNHAARAAHLAKVQPLRLQVYLDKRAEKAKKERKKYKKKGGILAV